MCGGRATRMKSDVEKPLIKIGGRPMVQRVLDALVESKEFSRIIAAVSPHTPATGRYLRELGIEIFTSKGDGYSRDLSSLLAWCKPNKVFVIPADLALINASLIEKIIDKVSKIKNCAAISVACDLEYLQKLSLEPSVFLNDSINSSKCHSGITVFDSPKVTRDEVREKYVTVNEVGVAVNVNTKKHLGLAEKLLVQSTEHFAK